MLHIALAVWVPGCAVACWWQVTIALSGDRLGWLYSIEWPSFAVFGAVVWWNLIHDDPDAVGAQGLRRLKASRQGADDVPLDFERIAQAEHDDPELTSYNDYLRRLAEHEPSSRWRRQ